MVSLIMVIELREASIASDFGYDVVSIVVGGSVTMIYYRLL